MNLDFLDCGRTTYDTIHLMYACIVRQTYEPNCLLTSYCTEVLKSCIFTGQALSQEGYVNNKVTFYSGGGGGGGGGGGVVFLSFDYFPLRR